MARRKKEPLEDDEDMAAPWPMIDSYTTEDGLFVKVYKAAYAVAGINKFNVRPSKAHL